MLHTFDHAISHLADNPLLGVVPRDDRLRKLGHRMLVIGSYPVLYVIKSKTVQTRRIIHEARDYGFLLS